MTFVRRLNEGNIYTKRWLQFIERTSTAKNSASGFQETYFLVCLLIRLENKSISGVTKVAHTALYILGFNCHSVVSWDFLECFSSWKLCLPGMFAALMCKSVLVPQIQISFAILLQSWDFRPPFLSIYDIAVVLSDIILICLKLLSLQEVNTLNWIGFNSNTYMWVILFSSHLPPKGVLPSVIRHPVKLASVYIVLFSYLSFFCCIWDLNLQELFLSFWHLRLLCSSSSSSQKLSFSQNHLNILL